MVQRFTKRLNTQKAKKSSQSIISCPMVLPKCAWCLECICKSCHFIWIEGRTILSTLMNIGWPNIFEWRASHHSFTVGKQLHFNITLAKGYQFGKYSPFHLGPKNYKITILWFSLQMEIKSIYPCSVFIERFTSKYMCRAKNKALIQRNL